MTAASVIPLDHKTAKAFIEKWHYSHLCPTGKNVHFGWFIGDALYAVATYGIGVNSTQERFLRKRTSLPIYKGGGQRGEPLGASLNCYELKRLCRIEPRNDAYPLTRFLASCHRALRDDHGIDFIFCFSDPTYGHSGGIYKAANFRHLGKTNAEWHLRDRKGNAWHRVYIRRAVQRYNANLKKGQPTITIEQARKVLGLVRVQTLPKDRWLLDIRRKSSRTLATSVVSAAA